MKLLYFGILSELAGQTEEEIQFVGSLQELRKQIVHKYAGFEEHPFQIAINQKIAQDELQLAGSEEVAFLPPFTGG